MKAAAAAQRVAQRSGGAAAGRRGVASTPRRTHPQAQPPRQRRPLAPCAVPEGGGNGPEGGGERQRPAGGSGGSVGSEASSGPRGPPTDGALSDPAAAAAAAGTTAAGDDALPTFMDGINWYCYTVLWLLFLVDFTPLGRALTAGPGAPLALAAFQLAAFVLPTLYYARSRGWDLARTFWLGAPSSAAWAAGGLALGPVVWLATSAAISLKTGVWLGGAGSSMGDAAGGGGVVGGMVAAAAAGSSPQDVAALFGAVAVAPAVMEELLFRGLLLTALLRRLGRVDAVAVCGALFSLVHLSVDQAFPFMVLGFAAGGVAVASGSVWPAVALHMGYNATGLAVGLALQAGGGGGA